MPFRQFAVLAASVLALAACGPADAGDAASLRTPVAADYGFKDLVREPGTPRLGAANADVTIIMYADYNCGYCKRMEPVLANALKADARLAVIHKEWPIFGDVSEHAARIALAANYQGRYEAVHRAFMLSPTRLSDKPTVEAVAKQTGVDWPRLTRDLKTHGPAIDAVLERNEREAMLLGLQGTPGLVINSYLLPGALTDDQLKALVQKIRAAQKPAA
jgi:protein-disulfide isomerase